MILFENRKELLLNIIKWGNNPFKKFVSTGEIKEGLDLVNSRIDLIQKIKELVESETNFILPIIGDVGSGKTHLFWALRNNLYYYNTIYISLEYVYKKLFSNIYSEFIENLEMEPLKFIVNQLCDKWGALERKFGFFHVADIEKVRKYAFEQLSDKYNEVGPETLMDVINGITIHQLDPYKKIEAERWLLGELMDEKELSTLNLAHDLRKGKNAYLMLRLLIENSKSGTILFIDDFGKIISIMSPQSKQVEEIFDPSWLYGTEETSNDIAADKIFNKIVQLQYVKGLRIIITLKSKESLVDIRKKYKEKNPELLSSIREPFYLLEFKEEDIYELYSNTMSKFYESIDKSDFTKEFQNPFYPLNKRILKYVFEKAEGNPRAIIKLLIKIFNEIIYSNESIDVILKDYENTSS
ncbi:MAG: hypothetical protein KGD68_01020 [Candidatus Lokiarchaeota archaeon]|nr:hypothetical protein [Candidatus Lokiarchaeota archaeon]